MSVASRSPMPYNEIFTPKPVLFPAPPPTTNSLTAQQRSQLVRTTNKLGRILGTTPHVLDTNSNDLALDTSFMHALNESKRQAPVIRIASSDSDSSNSPLDTPNTSPILPNFSFSSPASSLSRSSSVSSTKQGSIRSRSSRSSTSPPRASDVFTEAWLGSAKPPILKLDRGSSPLASIPPSPSSSLRGSPRPSSRTHSRSSSIDGSSVGSIIDHRFTLRPSVTTTASNRDSFTSPPSFTIPSANSLRRQKLERLQRKLGERIPIELVFPLGDDDEEDEDTEGSDSVSKDDEEERLKGPEKKKKANEVVVSKNNKALPGLPPPVLRPRTSSRISYSRDSLGEELSPHRAPRIKSPVATRPAPPPPQLPASVRSGGSLSPSGEGEKRRAKSLKVVEKKERDDGRLCVIVESVDEHGGSGWAETFGITSSSAPKSKVISVARTEGSENGFEAELLAWSTRKGYAGWPRATAPAEQSSQSQRQRKKRTSGYRKTPPSLSD